jgi:hypothetical protein
MGLPSRMESPILLLRWPASQGVFEKESSQERSEAAAPHPRAARSRARGGKSGTKPSEAPTGALLLARATEGRSPSSPRPEARTREHPLDHDPPRARSDSPPLRSGEQNPRWSRSSARRWLTPAPRPLTAHEARGGLAHPEAEREPRGQESTGRQAGERGRHGRGRASAPVPPNEHRQAPPRGQDADRSLAGRAATSARDAPSRASRSERD